MRSGKIKNIAVAVTILSLLAGCSPQQGGMGGRNGQMQRAVPVEVKKAVQEDFGIKLSLSGRVEASQQVELTSKTAGRVQQIHVKVGDQVKAGQPIVTLDGEEARIQLQRSQAALLSAQARYKQALEGTPAETLVQSRNSLADLQNKYDAAKKELERNEALFKEGAISAADLEKAKSAFVSAATNLENQKQKLKLDEKGPTQADIDAATAQLKQAEADYELARLNASNLVVKAPIDGTVGSLPVTVGANVSSNTVIASIINLATMVVKTEATESQVGLFQAGQTVDVSVPSVQFATKGKIVSVSPLADTSKTYPIDIEIANPGFRIKAGMIASIEMTGAAHKALVVPREAVIARDKEFYVYVVEEKKAKQVPVKVGESDGQRIEILDGLKGGEDVVVKGQNTLVAGSPVVVIDPNQPVNGQENAPENNQGNKQRRASSKG
ncbi:efflux RND transporter periplasmic adaptor subunit [Brevibacillus sp. SYP-B805]|uniref:efflux RND transporter periplasmic adaptor subunit n=1 Tax=Brevibacillus sp. SYP-B805 TaxID=1578199 RepID=UPI0013ECFC55|nr:efflux RND transporter periplasmic adaptor subunit [Brevibacillus sp. SYP-B805]NGQ97382.1 efflux RND transporter periplasmic adaptor subunit [Brevibacillus sp. SYP-B805]